ncbi:hypothetical protein [Psychroserpens sp. NJDZ02]|uniref:hypothetical protein n=1 Tax=Psychroserpens sp. NJDZ02 TaxID=2570561 RepID=UPI0010A89F23|nr:hypothetical protein [Psychroserpens sp. NJDZ02]QCE40571.1 hypothetical protein E9099_03770 [Psychroserpens sp. NJDZ02]
MKAKLIIIAIAFLSLTSFTTTETLVVSGVYKGVVEYDYVFAVAEEGAKENMLFQYVSEEALESFDLESDDYVGSQFTVTYEKTTEMSEDEEGNEIEIQVLTITGLELND